MELIWGSGVFYNLVLRTVILASMIAPFQASAGTVEKKATIFSLPGVWENQNGEKVSFKDLQGKVTVMSMIYTNCDYACPLITRKLKIIHDKLGKETEGKVKFLLVSFDPERDTVKKLKEYSQSQKLDESSFALLTSTSENAHALGMALGFQYKKKGKDHFSHSNLITVLDKDGVIAHQQESGAKLEPLLEIVQKLVKK